MLICGHVLPVCAEDAGVSSEDSWGVCAVFVFLLL
jgi:hypothetical protein